MLGGGWRLGAEAPQSWAATKASSMSGGSGGSGGEQAPPGTQAHRHAHCSGQLHTHTHSLTHTHTHTLSLSLGARVGGHSTSHGAALRFTSHPGVSPPPLRHTALCTLPALVCSIATASGALQGSGGLGNALSATLSCTIWPTNPPSTASLANTAWRGSAAHRGWAAQQLLFATAALRQGGDSGRGWGQRGG